MTEPEAEYWYRYENGSLCPVKLRYRVLRHTPKGVWIEAFDQLNRRERWVSKHTIKQWASPTPELALQAFICRRQRQVKILRRQLREAKLAIRQAQDLQEGKTVDRVYNLVHILHD